MICCTVYVKCVLVVCILEGSGKWPDSIEAIKRLKAAYYLSLSQALGKIAPSVLSAAYTNYLEIYKVCSKIVGSFFDTFALNKCKYSYANIHVLCTQPHC